MDDSPTLSPEGEQMFRLIVEHYGDRFTPEQRAEVRTGVASLIAVTTALRAVPLDNRLAPSTVFVPYRQEE